MPVKFTMIVKRGRHFAMSWPETAAGVIPWNAIQPQ